MKSSDRQMATRIARIVISMQMDQGFSALQDLLQQKESTTQPLSTRRDYGVSEDDPEEWE